MYIDNLSIYAFNDKEKKILYSNKDIVSGKIKLCYKEVKVYFILKRNKEEIGLTDLVKKCLIRQGYDINSKELYKKRKKPNSDEFYDTVSFLGTDEYRVDTFSRCMSKLVKVGLVESRRIEGASLFKTVIQD